MAQLSGVVTDEGQAEVVDILHEKAGGAAAESFHHAGWGTGTTAAAVTDTALGGITTSRVDNQGSPANYSNELAAASVTQPSADVVRADFVLHLSDAHGGLTIAEVGLFDEETATPPPDELFVRCTHTSRALIGGDRIHYTIDVTFADVVLAEFADGSAAEFADGATIEFA